MIDNDGWKESAQDGVGHGRERRTAVSAYICRQ